MLPQGYSSGVDPGALERWDSTERSAKEDAERIRAGMPAKPQGAHSSWVKAWNELDGNLKAIRSIFHTYNITNEYGRPERHVGGARVEAAKMRLARAQRLVAEARR